MVLSEVIPKPDKTGREVVDGVGKAFVRFQDLTAARKFQAEPNGRKSAPRDPDAPATY